MSNYAIINVKTFDKSALTGIKIHNQRLKESLTNTNIDKDKKHLNYDLVECEDITDSINKKLSHYKIEDLRKDAIYLNEFVITASPEYMNSLSTDKQKQYFETAVDFIKEKYGDYRLNHAIVHMDETTPHMHIGIVPISFREKTMRKMNATVFKEIKEHYTLSTKDVIGNKPQFIQLQNEFPQYMQLKGFKVERGKENNVKGLSTIEYKIEKSKKELETLGYEKNAYVEVKELQLEYPKYTVSKLNKENLVINKSDFEKFQNNINKQMAEITARTLEDAIKIQRQEEEQRQLKIEKAMKKKYAEKYKTIKEEASKEGYDEGESYAIDKANEILKTKIESLDKNHEIKIESLKADREYFENNKPEYIKDLKIEADKVLGLIIQLGELQEMKQTYTEMITDTNQYIDNEVQEEKKIMLLANIQTIKDEVDKINQPLILENTNLKTENFQLKNNYSELEKKSRFYYDIIKKIATQFPQTKPFIEKLFKPKEQQNNLSR